MYHPQQQGISLETMISNAERERERAVMAVLRLLQQERTVITKIASSFSPDDIATTTI
jgi:hypothetical protein